MTIYPEVQHGKFFRIQNPTPTRKNTSKTHKFPPTNYSETQRIPPNQKPSLNPLDHHPRICIYLKTIYYAYTCISTYQIKIRYNNQPTEESILSIDDSGECIYMVLMFMVLCTETRWQHRRRKGGSVCVLCFSFPFLFFFFSSSLPPLQNTTILLKNKINYSYFLDFFTHYQKSIILKNCNKTF